MKKYTEKDLINRQSKYLFRIKNLVKNKNVPIQDIGECLDYPMHINFRDSLKMDYLNECGLNMINKALNTVRNQGIDLMKQLIEPNNMADSFDLIRQFNSHKDEKQYFSFYQNIRDRVDSEYHWRVTTRCVLDDTCFISNTFSLRNLEKSIVNSEKILPPDVQVEENLLKFQALSKREKEVLALIANGYSSRTISDMLFISYHTVNVHRKNIIRKLDIKNQAGLFRMAQLINRI